MKKQYAIDSKGQVHELISDKELLTVSPIKRLNDLKQSSFSLISQCKSYMKISDNARAMFFYMIQPFENKDKIVFITKTPIVSSSNEVKLSNMFKNDRINYRIEKNNYRNEFYTDFTEDMLQSIFSSEENYTTQWWVLNAFEIVFERNNFDGEIISVVFDKPIPYHSLITKLKDKVIDVPKNGKIEKNDNTIDKYLIINDSNFQITDINNLIKSAAIFSDLKTDWFKLRDDIVIMFDDIKSNCDKYSNVKSDYLNLAISNPCIKIFPIYQALKIFLLKRFAQVSTVQYHENKILFNFAPFGKQYIYVSQCDDDYFFILGGKLYKSLDEVKYALIHYKESNCFDTPKWFGSYDNNIIEFYKNLKGIELI